jgi:hypothetical protein
MQSRGQRPQCASQLLPRLLQHDRRAGRVWEAQLADDGLEVIRTSVEILNHTALNDCSCEQAVEAIAREVNGLSRLSEELRDSRPG